MIYITVNLDHTGGSGASEIYLAPPTACTLVGLSLVPNVGTSKAPSNFITVKAVDSAGADIFAVNTSDASGVALVVGTAVANVTLSSSADLSFAANEAARLRIVDSASGASANVTAVFEFAPARSV